MSGSFFQYYLQWWFRFNCFCQRSKSCWKDVRVNMLLEMMSNWFAFLPNPSILHCFCFDQSHRNRLHSGIIISIVHSFFSLQTTFRQNFSLVFWHPTLRKCHPTWILLRINVLQKKLASFVFPLLSGLTELVWSFHILCSWTGRCVPWTTDTCRHKSLPNRYGS